MVSTAREIGTVLRVSAGAIHVRVDGAEGAPAVLLVHGFCSSVHWWDRVTRLLSQNYRVIRLDLLGHGCSDPSTTGYRPADQAAMIEEVLGVLGVEQVAAVGHSMGAGIVVALAERSERVTSVVVINEGPGYEFNTFPLIQHLLLTPILGDLLTRRPPAVATRFGLARGFAPGYRLADGFSDIAIPMADAHISHEAFRGGLLGKRTYSDEQPLDDRLRQLALPALVIWGTEDQLWATEGSVERYRDVANVHVELIGESGHSPQVENPERCAALIAEFLPT